MQVQHIRLPMYELLPMLHSRPEVKNGPFRIIDLACALVAHVLIKSYGVCVRNIHDWNYLNNILRINDVDMKDCINRSIPTWVFSNFEGGEECQLTLIENSTIMVMTIYRQ